MCERIQKVWMTMLSLIWSTSPDVPSSSGDTFKYTSEGRLRSVTVRPLQTLDMDRRALSVDAGRL